MQCKSCGSKWESTTQVTICPFCGAKLIIDKDPNDTNIAEVIESLISSHGIEILKNAKLVTSYVMDLVRGHDREKKLFRLLCNYDILNGAYKIASTTDNLQRDIIIKKQYKILVDEAFLSEDNAAEALNIVLSGLGVEKFDVEKPTPQPKTQVPTDVAVNGQVESTDVHTNQNIYSVGSDRQYDAACRLKTEAREKSSVAKIEQAVELFALLNGYKDSDQQIANCEQIRLEIIYAEAVKEKSSAFSYRDPDYITQILDRAATTFRKLGNFKDSEHQAKECKMLKLKLIYQLADETRISADKYQDETIYSKALMLYGLVRGYEDADKRANYCAEQLEITHKDAVYRKAVALSQKNDSFSLECAIENFSKILDWKDSRVLCSICRERKQELAQKEMMMKQQKAEEERKQIVAARMANGLCAYCGGEFKKKLFHEPVCKNCGREKSYK